jgi:hypothetical protein
MTTIIELAKKYNRSRQRIWKWLASAKIVPHYLGSIVHPVRKGTIAVLDDDQIEQLEAWANRKS